MAHAEIKIVEIPQPPKIEEGVGLFLTPDEASTLARVLELIGGHPTMTPRGLMTCIYAALLDAGVKPNKAAVFEPGSGIYFVAAETGAEQAAAAYEKARAETPVLAGEVPRPKINRFI